MRRLALKRLTSISLVAMLSMLMMCSIAFAAPAQSLDDIVNQPTNNSQQTEQPVEQSQQNNQQPAQQPVQNNTNNSGSSTQTQAKGFINDLGEASDMSDANETVAKAAEPMRRMVAIVVQIISYVITFGLTLRVVLDLAYIAVPFLRTFLANGHQGNPQTGANTMGNPMMGGGMSPMGGMGGGMMGGGMMGGMGRYGGMGGMGSGMMGNMGMGAMNGTSNVGANDMGSRMNRIQWVSNAALNAVAAETTVGPDGRPVSPFKIYAKDMIIVMVITPVMLVLAVTGTLTDIGFLLGDLVCRVLNNLGGMM